MGFPLAIATEAIKLGINPHSYVWGVKTLIAYGIIGTIEQLFVAPTQGQIPLIAGFTLETAWSAPARSYVVGVEGLSPELQVDAHLAGQYVIRGYPIRTHTTGLIDYGVRNGIPGSEVALSIIHPGRVERIHAETLHLGQLSLTPSESGGTMIDEPIEISNGEPWSLNHGFYTDPNGLTRKDYPAGAGGDWDPGPEGVLSAMGFASSPSGSSGGIVNDYTKHAIVRI